MSPRPVIHVLSDPPLDGPTNMARDEALLDCAADDRAPTLRLYQWCPATISLGYFQRYADLTTMPDAKRPSAIVRRLTGGGAILHDRELTYSLCVPTSHALLTGGPSRLYEVVHSAVLEALAALGVRAVFAEKDDDSGPRRGPLMCFARRHRYDLLVGNEKIAGSAQRRTRKAVLQHGSIILADRHERQETARPGLVFEDAVLQLRTLLPLAFSAASGLGAESRNWNAEELAAAAKLVPKYAGTEWTKRL